MKLSKKWSNIRDSSCESCKLGDTAQHVCLLGRGNLKADVVLIGEAPGFREDDIGKPFAGRSGKLLDEILIELGVNREDIYITNVVHCRPPDNRTPSNDEIKTCLPYLQAELDLIKPSLIIPMGNVPMKAIIKRSGITKYRGRSFDYSGDGWSAMVMPTFHPAGVLRNPGNLEYLAGDLEKGFEFVRGGTIHEDARWKIIRTIDEVSKVCDKVEKAGVAAFDLETNGTKEWRDGALICTIGISWKKGTGVCIPIFHSESPFSRSDIKVIYKLLRTRIFQNEDILKVGQNMKFDWRWLKWRAKIDLRGPIFDTMLAHYVLYINSRHDLDSLSLEYTNYGQYWKDVDELGIKKGNAFDIPLDKLGKYNATDCAALLDLYPIFDKELDKIPKLRRVFDTLIMPAVPLFVNMESRGMLIDTEQLEKLDKKFQKVLKNMYKDLMKFKGCKKFLKYMRKKKGEDFEINFNSAPQKSKLLFSRHGFNFPSLVKTKAGGDSTAEEVLVDLIFKEKCNPKVLTTLIEYGKVRTLHSTFVKGMWKHIGPDSRVRPNVKIHGTRTGRPSCTEPNIMNIPRVYVDTEEDFDSPLKAFIKTMFIAPPGYKIVEIDYSQAELRVKAHMANDKEMIRWFNDGEDVHLAVAKKMFRSEDISKAKRKRAKTINFGIIYCVGDLTLAKNLSSPKKGIFVDPAEAGTFKNEYFELFPKIEQSIHKLQRKAIKRGYSETLFGRRRYLPDLKSDKKWVREEAKRQSVNSPIQGTAADFTLMSLLISGGYIGGHRYIPEDVHFINTVYDSMLFEVPTGQVKNFVKMMKKIAENIPTKKYFGFKMKVPMITDAEAGKIWSELKEVK